MKYLKLILTYLVIFSFISCSEDKTSTELDRTLDLQTLEAETKAGTLHAERAENSYVGSLGDERVIGITYHHNVSTGNHSDEQVVVFLYDGQDLAVLMGDIDSDGVGTLRTTDISDFDASVEITFNENTVSGKAFFPDFDVPFTAHKSSGNAGIYWAHGTNENPEISGYWVVLSDQSQWGCVCVPPFTNPCCTLHL